MMYMGSWNTSSYKLEDVEAAWPGANDGELLEYVMEKLKKGGQLLPLARVQRTYSVVASRSHLSPETATIIEEKRKERSEEHTSELQSLMRISYDVFCLKKKTIIHRYGNNILR